MTPPDTGAPVPAGASLSRVALSVPAVVIMIPGVPFYRAISALNNRAVDANVAVGQAAATGLNFADNLANRATTIGADLSNQMGVGHNQYVPDFSSPRRGGGSSKEDGNPAVNGSGPDADQGQGGSGR